MNMQEDEHQIPHIQEVLHLVLGLSATLQLCTSTGVTSLRDHT